MIYEYIGEPVSDEIATTCDDCNAEIPFRVTCFMVYTGEVLDGAKVVKVVCAECYSKG